MEIRTQRLLLRAWKEEDLEPFAQMNADPRVREFFPGLQTREESDASVNRALGHIQKYGWGLWAVSLLDTGEFIGFIGIAHVPFSASFTPAVEIGWRLAHRYWGQGYATEGALACLKYGFETLQLQEIVAFTTPANKRSRSVMEKIGMHHDASGDFDHPLCPEGLIMRRQVLYRLRKEDWQK